MLRELGLQGTEGSVTGIGRDVGDSEGAVGGHGGRGRNRGDVRGRGVGRVLSACAVLCVLRCCVCVLRCCVCCGAVGVVWGVGGGAGG